MPSNKYCSAVSDGRKTYSVLKMSNSINLWALIKSGSSFARRTARPPPVSQFGRRKEDNDIYKNKSMFTSNKYMSY